MKTTEDLCRDMKNTKYRKISLRPLSAAARPGSCCIGAAVVVVVVVVTQTLQMCCRCTAPDTAVLQPPASCCMQSPSTRTLHRPTTNTHPTLVPLCSTACRGCMTKQGFRALKYYEANSTGLVSGLNVFNFMWGSGKCRQSPADCSPACTPLRSK